MRGVRCFPARCSFRPALSRAGPSVAGTVQDVRGRAVPAKVYLRRPLVVAEPRDKQSLTSPPRLSGGSPRRGPSNSDCVWDVFVLCPALPPLTATHKRDKQAVYGTAKGRGLWTGGTNSLRG